MGFNTQQGTSTTSHKTYRALLTQTGGTGAPIVVVLENTIGNIVWTRSSQGEYVGTLAGAFIEGKTFFLYPPFNDLSNPGDAHYVFRSSDNTIGWGTEDSTGATDGLLKNHSLQILVYP